MAARILGNLRATLLLTVVGLGVFVVVGNALLLCAHVWARGTSSVPVAAPAGIRSFRPVDDVVLRGAAPSRLGYKSLAQLGVTTIVDLRAEEDLDVPTELLDGLGIDRVHLPVRDGQTPPGNYVERFERVVGGAVGKVFVHCGAGVGRTGAMAAAYLVETGQASSSEALQRNLEVGPPSLEQVAYASGMDGAGLADGAISGVSRILDAPRRIWSRLSG